MPLRREGDRAALVAEGELLWTPSESFIQRSVMAEYMRWLADQRGLAFESYNALWRWSVADLEAFWASIVEFFGVILTRPPERILGDRSMPGTKWFAGAELNYVQNMFRHASKDRPALVFQSNTRSLTEMSSADLEAHVSS